MQKKIIITGSTGNLGEAVVKKFLEEGCNVTGTVHSEIPSSENLNLKYYSVNLSDESAVKAFFSKAIEKYKTIDAALLLAGGYKAGKIENITEDEIKKMFSLNFETALYSAIAAFNQMMKQPSGGKIIFVGSRPAINPTLGKEMVSYSLSKSLLFRLAEIINADKRNKNVRASVIVPGTIDTPQNRESTPKADFSKWKKPEMIAETLFEICEGKIKENVIEF